MKPGSVLFVVNPVSGGTDKEEVREKITEFAVSQNISCSFFETSGQNDAAKLTQQILQDKPDVVAAVGGDGTVHLAAQALPKTNIPLAIIPMGSGNGLSKDLGIPQSIPDSLQVLVKNEAKRIDTLLVNQKLCIHLADLGFNALVVKRFDEASTRGPGTYAKVALEEYINFTPGHYNITTGTETFSGEAFMITITNARNFGSNATINPNAVLNDGWFEICILEPFPKAAAIGILLIMYNETIDKSVYSRIIRCKKATIINQKDELLQIDGEIMPPTKEVTVEIQEGNLQVLLPFSDAD